MVTRPNTSSRESRCLPLSTWNPRNNRRRRPGLQWRDFRLPQHPHIGEMASYSPANPAEKVHIVQLAIHVSTYSPRAGKLRCDHTLPTCGRCARRGKPDQCVYHPAPLTKAKVPGVTRHRTSGSRSSSFPTQAIPQPSPTGLVSPPSSTDIRLHDFTAFRPVNGSTLGHPLIVETPRTSNQGSSESHRTSAVLYTPDTMSLSGTKTGFLGASSYSADYDEKQAGLGIDEPDASPRRSVSPALHPISAELIHKGAEVLALLRDIRIFDCLMNRWLETGDGILVIKPFYCIWINEIIREFGQVLAQHERVEQLYGLSELVWRNTQVPMRFTGKTSPEQYALMATGNKLRWESLGLIFTGVAILASSLSDWDSFFSENKERLVDRPTFTRRMRVSIEACISYCKECEIMNELFVALLVRVLQ